MKRQYEHHKGSTTAEYRIWSHMIQRCENAGNPAFNYYGGRGILVCERWRRSFAAFIEDVGLRPSPKLSIDRINNDGNYEPGNCRWATRLKQAQNRRPNKRQRFTWVIIDGVLALRSGASRLVAVPRTGKKYAKKFQIIDLDAREKVIAVLDKPYALAWLWQAVQADPCRTQPSRARRQVEPQRNMGLQAP